MRYFVLYEDCISYYQGVDAGDRPLGFKGSAPLVNINEVICETRNSFFFREKKMSREKSETYVLVLKQGEGKEMLLGADVPEELEEWKEALRIAVLQQKLLLQAKKSRDKLPTTSVEEIEETLRGVEIQH